MENDERDELLKMSESEMTDVAKFCNRYPNIEMNHEVEDADDVKTGQPTIVNVTLEREDELQGNVIGKYKKNTFPYFLRFDNWLLILAPFYPGKRDEGWWLVIGEQKTNTLLAIKHVSLQQKKKIALELVPQKVPSQFHLSFCGHSRIIPKVTFFNLCAVYAANWPLLLFSLGQLSV